MKYKDLLSKSKSLDELVQHFTNNTTMTRHEGLPSRATAAILKPLDSLITYEIGY